MSSHMKFSLPKRLQDTKIAITAQYDPGVFTRFDELLEEPQTITVWENLWLLSPRGWARRKLKEFKGQLSLVRFESSDLVEEEVDVVINVEVVE